MRRTDDTMNLALRGRHGHAWNGISRRSSDRGPADLDGNPIPPATWKTWAALAAIYLMAWGLIALALARG